MATVAKLTSPLQGISCHAWSKDGSQLAVCPNSHELHIYQGTDNPDPATWIKTHVFTEHDLLISAVDWSPVTNKIVTCSHDRNAFVWTYHPPSDTPESSTTQITAIPSMDSSGNSSGGGGISGECTTTSINPSIDAGTWKPSLTLLRIDRAALDVKWSPDGKKFAVASGAKCVPVAHYEAEHDWWVCKHIKKHKSSILSVAWHPTSQLLATGGCDFRCRVFSAYDEAVDGTKSQSGPFPETQAFGELYVEFPSNSWVHSVAWSPSGQVLAFSGHDSRVHIVTFPPGSPPPPPPPPVHALVSLTGLPVTVLKFVSEKAIIGGGHDFNPLLLTGSGENWSFLQYLDSKDSSSSSSSSTSSKGVETSSVQTARALFQSKAGRVGGGGPSSLSSTQDSRNKDKDSDVLWTLHHGPILSLQPYPVHPKKGPGGISSETFLTYSTSAMDGRVIKWHLPELNVAMASIGLN